MIITNKVYHIFILKSYNDNDDNDNDDNDDTFLMFFIRRSECILVSFKVVLVTVLNVIGSIITNSDNDDDNNNDDDVKNFIIEKLKPVTPHSIL